jgi:hypothetical protein
MSPRIDRTQQCNVMGCTLPYMHSGMHKIIVCKSRRKSSNLPKVDDKRSARISNSPCNSRNYILIRTRDVELEMVKTRLLFLQKTIKDLTDTLQAE